MKEPGERTSMAQGWYLNFVLKKLVKVSPSVNATKYFSIRLVGNRALDVAYKLRILYLGGNSSSLEDLEALL